MPETEEQWRLAGRVAGCADLRDVRLFNVSGDLALPATANPMAYDLDVNIEFQTVGEEVLKAVVITGNYSLTVTEAGEEDDDEPAKVADLEFTLAAMYHLLEQDTDPRSYEDKEFEAFAATTGQFALYPYAREFVADMTGRMGLPSLHMGTLRLEREPVAEPV
jgi:preprotein translocase subunit SecB